MGTEGVLALVAMIALGVACLGVFLYGPWLSKELSASRWVNTWSASGVVLSATVVWSIFVNTIVQDAYMDEIFHIPQAQKYCQGNILYWDDKLTTPPGLYFVPLVTAWPLTQAFGFLPQVLCSPKILRLQNAVCICLLFWAALVCRRKIENICHLEHAPAKPLDFISQYSIHTALNIALFPVLFFFSGLYYTDVMSTLLVLVAFSNTLDRLQRRKSSALNSIWTVFLGTATLFMRQTNIFWIVVFLGSIEAIHSLKMLLPRHPEKYPLLPNETDTIKWWAQLYAQGYIWDAHMDKATPFDLGHLIVSVAVAAICNPFTILRQIWPHITTLAFFVGFVIWNGGVVLGDKSNHVATIHLPQMLYIWPMFTFFMLPLALPTLLELFKWVARTLSGNVPKDDDDHSHALKVKKEQMSQSPYTLYRLAAQYIDTPTWYWVSVRIITGCSLAVLVVYFNTIIHPFTLADNRHYMFYIFRYTIRVSLLLRLLLAYVYIGCAWLCFTMLRPCSDFVGDRVAVRGQSSCSESRVANVPERHGNSKDCFTNPDDVKTVRFKDTNVQHLHQANHPAVEPVLSSTVLILVIATTLSLITAPLVEPRYFILPWVFFRLLCPAWTPHDHKYRVPSPRAPNNILVRSFVAIGQRLDVRLVMETFWYLLINMATMYVFLYRPFHWKDADGNLLDEGRLQRFIW